MSSVKIILTGIVLAVWVIMMLSNVAAAGRTAGQLQTREDLSERDAQHHVTHLVLGWAIGLTIVAVALLVVIWRS